ncbi:MAG: hypothetical protein IKA41_02440 [Bacteroidaceae bacterium]|nr:hypothetical protein [Bacteroidaceae bacterium]
MKTRLNQLTMAEFIDLHCGDYSVLLENGEHIPEEDLKKKTTDLIFEYRNIVDPTGVKSTLLEYEEALRDNTKIVFFQVCKKLVSINAIDEVKDVLMMYGINLTSATKEKVAQVVEQELKTALHNKERNDANRENAEEDESLNTPENIRASYDAEIASLMGFYKMSIDIHHISAAVYANLLTQAVKSMQEIKKKANTP